MPSFRPPLGVDAQARDPIGMRKATDGRRRRSGAVRLASADAIEPRAVERKTARGAAPGGRAVDAGVDPSWATHCGHGTGSDAPPGPATSSIWGRAHLR